MPLHQLGTVTGVLNFFRSLGSAILVAVMGAVFLAAASSRAGGGGSVQTVVLEGAKAGIDFGPVFSGVFWAATIANLISLLFMIAMKELPLRGHHPATETAPH